MDKYTACEQAFKNGYNKGKIDTFIEIADVILNSTNTCTYNSLELLAEKYNFSIIFDINERRYVCKERKHNEHTDT